MRLIVILIEVDHPHRRFTLAVVGALVVVGALSVALWRLL